MRVETLNVPYIAPSLNSIYAGAHWSKRKRQADEAHLAVKIAAKGVAMFDNPVMVTYQPMIKGRAYDISNYAYSLKLIEDGLVRAGVLKDDTNAYVKAITIKEPIKVKAESSMVVIITEVEDD